MRTVLSNFRNLIIHLNFIDEVAYPYHVDTFCVFHRVLPDNMLLQVNDFGRTAPTFDNAATVAAAIIGSGYEFGSGKIYFNKFK